MLAAERMQGWSNPLVSVLTDAANYLDPPPLNPDRVVLSEPALASPPPPPSEYDGLRERLRWIGGLFKKQGWTARDAAVVLACEDAAAAIAALVSERDEARDRAVRNMLEAAGENAQRIAAEARVAVLERALAPFAEGAVDISETAVIVGRQAKEAMRAARAALAQTDKGGGDA